MKGSKLLKFVSILVFVLILFSPLESSVRGDYALQIVRELSDKKYAGREAGTLDNLRAIYFLKDDLRNIGLNKFIYQRFPVDVFVLKDTPEFILKEGDKKLKSYMYGKDFRDKFSGSWEKEGYIKKEGERLKDSFLLIDGDLSKNFIYAKMWGAEGVIMKVPKNGAEMILQKSVIPYKVSIPTIYISSDTYTDIASYMDKFKNLRAYYRIEYDKNSSYAKNLIFLIPSKSKEKETLVVSAHVDHLGKDIDGYFPGANDNASGVGVLIEIAKEIWERGNNYPFNILFLITNGEEKGLLGAEFFVGSPVVPIEDIFLNINIDCVGRGEKLFVSYNTYAEDMIKNMNIKNVSFVKDVFLDDSDQYAFHLKEIPTFFMMRANKDYSMPDLHQKTDTWDKIPKENLSESVQVFFDILQNVSSFNYVLK